MRLDLASYMAISASLMRSLLLFESAGKQAAPMLALRWRATGPSWRGSEMASPIFAMRPSIGSPTRRLQTMPYSSPPRRARRVRSSVKGSRRRAAVRSLTRISRSSSSRELSFLRMALIA